MRKIKMKYWKRPVEKKEKLQEKQIQTKEELSKDFAAYCGKEAFENGFDIAKSMIIEFLSQKSLGYNDAYFFKIRNIEALGEPDYRDDETMTEKDRVAKWDWSNNAL